MTPPAFDDDPGFLQGVKDLAVEQFIAKFRVEALAIAILPRAARHDVGSLGSDRRDPVAHGFGNELWAIVGTNMAGNAAQDEEIREHVDNIHRPQSTIDADRDAFACELVDHVEHPVLSPIVGAILDKVIGPDVVRVFRS